MKGAAFLLGLGLLIFTSPLYASEDSDIVNFLQGCSWANPYHPLPGRRDEDRSEVLHDYYFLSPGTGISIWRVVPKDMALPSYVLKEYGQARKYDTEAVSYRGLAKAKAKHPEIAAKTFEIVSSEDLGARARAIKLNDVRGRSLAKVLDDRRVPETIKEKLRKDYEAKALEYVRLIKVAFGAEGTRDERYGVLSHYWEIQQMDGPHLILNLNADQIVVSFDFTDPTKFKLTLVDPY